MAMKQRRGTAAAWTSANSILAAGQLGIETDTGFIKVGDGATAWNSLAYILKGSTYAPKASPVFTGAATASSGLIVGSEVGGYVVAGNHKMQVIATGAQTPVMVCGGSGAFEFWSDTGPSFAWGFGLAIPGNSITNDWIFSRYAPGGWVEKFRIKSTGILNIANAPNYASNAAAISGGLVTGDVYRNGDNLCIVH